MTHFSAKSHVHRLVTVLSFVGEYPAHSHHLLGKERVMNQGLYRAVSDKPAFYLAKDIKRVGGAEMNKTMFTRMAGAVFSPGGCYAVYNTRTSAMKWSGMGEFKALHSLMEIGRMNAGVPEVDSAVLLGESYEAAVKTLLDSEESKRLEFRFDGIYRHIYFIAMNEPGVRQLKLLMLPEWKRNMQEVLFDAESLAFDKGIFEYDAFVDGIYVFSHLDSDLAKLIRFKEAVTGGDGRYEVVCYPHQLGFLKEYLGGRVGYKTIGMELLGAEMALAQIR